MRLLARYCIVLVIPIACLRAVESEPVPVLKVIDGDTIEVATDLGGLKIPMKVRLLYVDTPESKDNDHGNGMTEGAKAKEFLAEKLPTGSSIKLFHPGNTIERDAYGRLLAIVYRPEDMIIGAGDNPGQLQTCWVNVNCEVIRAGWSPVWRKYGDPEEKMLKALLDAQHEAEIKTSGAWSTNLQWMKDKANERTAAKHR